MSSQGPNFPGTATSVSVTTSTTWGENSQSTGWSNPGNIEATDGVYATVNVGINFYTWVLLASNFGFSIPGGSTINGITVSVICHAASTSVEDFAVYLTTDTSADAPSGCSNLASLTGIGSTDQTNTYGGSTNLWGESSITVATVNSTGFGAGIMFHQVGGGGTKLISVDSITMQVFYTAAAGGGQPLLVGPTGQLLFAPFGAGPLVAMF